MLEASGAFDWLGPKELPVILKPNLVLPSEASEGATTHPEIAEALIVLLKEGGWQTILIAEGSWVGDSTAKAYRSCGYTELSRRYGIRLIDLQKDEAVALSPPPELLSALPERERKRAEDALPLQVCRTILDVTAAGGSLINLPLIKGHGQTLVTCALKNLKGCIPDSEKRRYHRLGVHLPVALLNTLIRPSFALADGLNPDPGWEEGGNPLRRDLLLLGRDPVSLDSAAAGLLSVPVEDVTYIGMARELGIGEMAGRGDLVDLSGPPSSAPESGGPEGRAPEETATAAPAFSEQAESIEERDALRRKISELVVEKDACSACFGNLVSVLRKLDAEGKLGTEGKLHQVPSPIYIGQEFRGKQLPEAALGIGICTKGAKQWVRGCPPGTGAIGEFLEGAIDS